MDNNSEVRAYAALALGKLNDTRTQYPLIQALGDQDDKVRANAAEALGLMNWLIQELGDPNPNIRSRAIETLGDIGNGQTIDPLKNVSLNDKDLDVRIRAAEALEKLGAPLS